MDKIEKINEMEVVDWDVDGNELIYVTVADTEENRAILRDIGADEQDIENMYIGIDESELDITEFVFNNTDATGWYSDRGFVIE